MRCVSHWFGIGLFHPYSRCVLTPHDVTGMKASLLRENLALAARLKSKKDLKKAIHDYVDSGLPTDECAEYEEALREYDVIKTRDGACLLL